MMRISVFQVKNMTITDNVVEAFKKIYGSMSKETAVFYDDLTRGEFYDLSQSVQGRSMAPIPIW